LLPGLQFDSGSVLLDPGETVVVFTDGVVEARNALGGVFGAERLAQVLADPIPSAAAAKELILAELAAFTAGVDQADDITLLVVRRPA
jgi:sigma-B regulation protein RsbU (phosphoserine phosphatase)